MPRLDIRIVGASNLPDVQTFGTIDPFCTVEFEHKRFQTATADNTENPRWNEVFKFNVADADSSQLMFSVWNDNKISDDFLGCYPMSISGLDRGEVEEKTVLLKKCKSNAELTIRVKAVDFGEVEEEETPCAPPRQKPQGGLPQEFQAQYAQQQQQQQQYFQQAPPQQFQAPPPPPARVQQYPPQQGYPPQGQPGYPPQGQPGYPPQGQPGYPPQQQPGYPPQQQPGYPPQQQPGYPPQQQPGYPPQQQPGYPPQGQPGYPPQQQPGYPPQQQPGYPPQQQQPPQGGAPPGFNPEEYIALHVDLQAAAAGQANRSQWAIQHWNDFGHNEGRAYSRSEPPYDFNPEGYMAKYPDLAAAVGGNPDRAGWARNHWLSFGVNEGRRYR